MTIDGYGQSLCWSDLSIRWTLGLCSRSYCESGWSIGDRWSRSLLDLDLWVVLDGCGWMRIDGRRVELNPGLALLARPGVRYEAEQDPDRRLVVDALHFDLIAPDGVPVRGGGLPGFRLTVPDVAAAGALTRRVIDRFHARPSESVWRTDVVATGLLRGLLLDLVDATVAEQKAMPCVAWEHRVAVTRAEARLRENPADPPSVGALAEEAGYSADHFGRLFKQITGRSPQAAAIAARIDRARHLLRVTPMNVTQIAEALGYADVYFFSRQFKKITGQSPTAYRRDPVGVDARISRGDMP